MSWMRRSWTPCRTAARFCNVGALPSCSCLIRNPRCVGRRQHPAQRSGAGSRWVDGCLLGGGFQSDLVAEGFELADVVALGTLRVGPGVVEASAQVVVAQVGVGQQVPDDDQNGAADRDDGLLGAWAPRDAPVALAQEGAVP